MNMAYENGNHTKMVTYEHVVIWTYENGSAWKMVTYARILSRTKVYRRDYNQAVNSSND